VVMVSSALEPASIDIHRHHLVQSGVDSALEALEVELVFEHLVWLFSETIMHLCC